MESHLEDLAQILATSDCNSVLYDTAGHPHNIHLLEGIIADKPQWNLSRDHHQGNAVIMCIRNTGDGVGGSRTAGNDTYSRLARSSGIALGLMDECLLVSGKHQSE